MSDQLLTPFKAKFQLNLENHICNLFTENQWRDLFLKSEKVLGNYLAKITFQDFDYPQKYKDANIRFNADFIKNTYEQTYTIDMYDSIIRIQLDSYIVTVLQSNEQGYLFSYEDGSTYVTKTDANFKLIRIES